MHTYAFYCSPKQRCPGGTRHTWCTKAQSTNCTTEGIMSLGSMTLRCAKIMIDQSPVLCLSCELIFLQVDCEKKFPKSQRNCTPAFATSCTNFTKFPFQAANEGFYSTALQGAQYEIQFQDWLFARFDITESFLTIPRLGPHQPPELRKAGGTLDPIHEGFEK